MHFILATPVLSNHLSYVSLFQCSLERSHKSGLTVHWNLSWEPILSLRKNIFKDMCFSKGWMYIESKVVTFKSHLTHRVVSHKRGNHIGGVLVSMLASSVVDHGFESWLGQTKDYKIDMCCFCVKHTALK